MAFRQEGEDDDKMTLMHTTIIGAWHEGGVQQGCPSQEGGSRLMHFELPRRRPKAIQVRAHLGVQKWHAPKLTSRSYKSPFWTFFVLIWKGNFIELPTAPAPHQNSIRVNGNCRNKWTSRICQGAARPSFGPFACESCWST